MDSKIGKAVGVPEDADPYFSCPLEGFDGTGWISCGTFVDEPVRSGGDHRKGEA